MKRFKIVYKDVDTSNLMVEEVSEEKARECQKKQGSSQGLYLGNAYIRGLEVIKISESSDDRALPMASFCSKCEKGWIFGENGAYPCSCNLKGQDAIRGLK
jgi:hypothetical protein